jgi:hypothetical protein
LPNIADRIEYSRLAASDPNEKLGSNGTLKRGSLGENDSAAQDKSIRMKAMSKSRRIRLHVVGGAIEGSELLSVA